MVRMIERPNGRTGSIQMCKCWHATDGPCPNGPYSIDLKHGLRLKGHVIFICLPKSAMRG